ncbi:leucine-rich repeat-containing protein 24-like [Amphibalanus amphitrite]|uniref:leucine-rich repeat-containing protein 24-like n=1 Tax=Amphibalanus amphitrite TaxID=1232801 RepID=UPI001C91179D|nr:leucine-rich repeat-containing protein 24-like [Amphibalanus amphitrite]
MRWRRAMAAVPVLLLLLMPAVQGEGKCPEGCQCIWKYGRQAVECQNAQLQAVPDGLDVGTQVLDLSGNELRELPAEVFRRAGLVNLQRVYLANCRLGRVADTALAGLTNLIDLDLSGNKLTSVPQAALRSVPALRELKLANNPIQRVTADAFAAVPGLVKLDLSDCQILEVETPAFDALNILEILKISGNRLRELAEPTVMALRSLHNVELHANPWECDCRLRPMRDWLHRQNVPYPIAPTCHGPPRLAGRTFEQLRPEEFACRPQLLPMVRQLAVTARQNVTLTCRISAEPAASVSWFWRGQQLDNSTILPGGRRPRVVQQGGAERVSRLIIPAVSAGDADGEFVCVGANRAGDAETSFTLSVGEPEPVVQPSDAGMVAGLVVGLLLLLLVIAVCAILLVRRLRRRQDQEAKSKPPPPSGLGSVVTVETAPDDDVNPVQKPPRLTELGYGSPAVYVRSAPDLINEIDGRRPAEYGSLAGYGATPAYGTAPVYGGTPVYGTTSAYGGTPLYGSSTPYGPAPGGEGSTAGYGATPVYTGGGHVNHLADESYELQQLGSPAGSELGRSADPAVYGYPADFGLPMPELGSPQPAVADGLRPLSTSSAEFDLSTSRDSVGSAGRRRWQGGGPADRVGQPAGTDV